MTQQFLSLNLAIDYISQLITPSHYPPVFNNLLVSEPCLSNEQPVTIRIKYSKGHLGDRYRTRVEEFIGLVGSECDIKYAVSSPSSSIDQK